MGKRVLNIVLCLVLSVACCGALGCSSKEQPTFTRIVDRTTGREYWIGASSVSENKRNEHEAYARYQTHIYIPYDGLAHYFEYNIEGPCSEPGLDGVYRYYDPKFIDSVPPFFGMTVMICLKEESHTCRVRLQVILPQEPIPELTFAPTGIVEELSRDQEWYTYKYDGQEHRPECYADVDGERVELKQSAIKAIYYPMNDEGYLECVRAGDWPKEVGTYRFLYFVDEYEGGEPNRYAPASKWITIEIIE